MTASFKTQIKRALPDVAVDWITLIRRHRLIHGQYPRIFHPRTFNEKILRRSLFDRRPIFRRIADKLAVRDYVAERLGSQVLPRLYHVTQDPRTIPFDDLPREFVVKPNHGSGWVEIVKDKSKCDRDAIIRKCESWLKQSYYLETREIPYRGIPPRILVEERINDGHGDTPCDYKFHVFDGKVKLILLIVDRFSAAKTKGYFSPEWEQLT